MIYVNVSFLVAGLAISVGWASAWYADGSRFDPPVWQNSFVDIGHKIISTAILPPTADSSRAVVSYWRQDVHYVLLNRLGLSLPRKSVVRLTDCLDMTIAVNLVFKPQNNNIIPSDQ